MIDVTANLQGRSVFLAGEHVECLVTFTNVTRSSRTESPAKPKRAKLAWASAQIHCQCSVTEGRVTGPAKPGASDANPTSHETSFVPFKGEKGSTVLATRPTILFCDLTLMPGDSQTYTYREILPLEAPPSFRGTAVKYSYKITIGTQHFNCPTKLLRMPFRVLVVPGLNDLSVYQDQDVLKPNNPFLKQDDPENSVLDIALSILQTITCRKGPSFYNITNSRGKVAKFCLFKQAYRIGDDIVGTCDFNDATVACVQFTVTLQSEEQVAAEWCREPGRAATLTSYGKSHEFCLHTRKTHVSLPIPLTATPAFVTDMVSLRWRLHFEFVTCRTPPKPIEPPENPSKSAIWQAPAELDVETMVWDLPIKVFATNPIYASSVLMTRTRSMTFA